ADAQRSIEAQALFEELGEALVDPDGQPRADLLVRELVERLVPQRLAHLLAPLPLEVDRERAPAADEEPARVGKLPARELDVGVAMPEEIDVERLVAAGPALEHAQP